MSYQIYVACLASYNNGVIHGAWIDCEYKSADDLMDEVSRRVLLTSPYPNVMVTHPDTGKQVQSAEEWAIHDHEGFGWLLQEYTSLDTVANVVATLEEGGEGTIIALHYLVQSAGYSLIEALERVEDVYVSETSASEWAAERYESFLPDDLPFIILNNIDWESVAKEMELGGAFSIFDWGSSWYLIEDHS